MPTYLTPGVYVEEIPSASKPIEGVGTAVAAFVGLAPGGPVNTPMRISNWTQFAKIYGDPVNPDNGPFMEGAYLAHSVYGFFQNGGSLAWIVRVGADGGGASAPRAALPAATDKDVEAFRVVALDGVDDPVTVELAEEEPGATSKDGEATYKLTVKAGSETEVHEGLTLKKGRANIATKVNAASTKVRVEEVSASLPETRVATGSYALSAPAQTPDKVDAGQFEGDVAKRSGMGGLAAVDEVTMVVMPDIMTLANNGDDAQIRDLQGKMISHCENAGDRMAILDCPPNLLPQDILEWRMNTAGYDSKMAALYYPWIETMNPLTRQPTLIPPSGHMAGVWCRVDSTRGVHKAPANEVVMGANGLAFQITGPEQGGLNKVGINCIRAFSGRGDPLVGRPDPLQRPGVALHQRAPALQLRLRVDHGRHAVERVRAQRPGAVDAVAGVGDGLPARRLPLRRAVRRDRGGGLLREVRLGDQPARGGRRRPGDLRDRHLAGQAGGVRRLPAEPVHRRRRRRSRRVNPPPDLGKDR